MIEKNYVMRVEPYGLAGQEAIADRLVRLREPHMVALTAFVHALRESTGQDIPYFDPESGGAGATVLLLLESPGPKAAKRTGFISPDNPDPTARNIFMLLAESRLSRQQVLCWNIVPWYLADVKPNASAIRAGADHLGRLLQLLVNLKVVVLMGGTAQSGWKYTNSSAKARLRVLLTFHPGGQSLNPHPQRRAHILRTFQDAQQIVEATPT